MVFVFCPMDLEDKIKEILQKNNVVFEINVSSGQLEDRVADNTIICHVDSERLSDDVKLFLVESLTKGRKVLHLASYLDNHLGYTEINLLSYKYFLQHRTFSILSKKRTQIVKRVMDLICSFVLLILCSPILLITALAIRLESRGGIFFCQKRVGQFNQEFTVIKLRSMVSDAEAKGAQWAKVNDARVTRVGKFIRKTRIDELPQLLNVIKGEMSLIGPRPEREVFIQNLEKEIPFYRFRHAVKPGITGLAQVKYPYGASIEDAKWKHRYDIFYIKHHNVFQDIKIIFLTIKTVLFGMGR